MKPEKIVFKKNSNAASRIIAGKALIVKPDSAESFVLNETGAEIWNAINGRRTLKELAGIVCSKFDVSKATAEKDADELLEGLEKGGLILKKGGKNKRE